MTINMHPKLQGSDTLLISTLKQILSQPYAEGRDLQSFLSTYHALWKEHEIKEALKRVIFEPAQKSPQEQRQIEQLLEGLIKLFGRTVEKQGSHFQRKDLVGYLEIAAVCLDTITINRLKLSLLKHSQDNTVSSYIKKFRTPDLLKDANITFTQSILLQPKSVAIELATILSMIQSYFIEQISREEFAKCKWMKSNRKTVAPTLSRAIDFFNFLTARVATDIVMAPDENTRADNICKIIKVAREVNRLHNFDVLAALIAGLSCCAVSRLKKTWKLVPKKVLVQFEELSEVVSPLANYRTYREIIAELEAKEERYIPLLSVVLRDVAVADASHPDAEDGLPNIDKVFLLAKSIHPIVVVQTTTHTPHHSRGREIYRRAASAATIPMANSEQYHILTVRLAAAPAMVESLQLKQSYQREAPANNSLLDDDEDESEEHPLDTVSSCPNNSKVTSVSMSSLTLNDMLTLPNRDRARIVRCLQNKPVTAWSVCDVFVTLEIWGLPYDLCHSLAGSVFPNGQSLLEGLDDSQLKEHVPQLGYRKQLRRNISALRKKYSFNGENSEDSESSSVTPPQMEWHIEDVYTWATQTPDVSPFADMLRQNKVDGGKLFVLSASELQVMGVPTIGKRKAILRQIQALANHDSGLHHSKVSRCSLTRRSAGF